MRVQSNYNILGVYMDVEMPLKDLSSKGRSLGWPMRRKILRLMCQPDVACTHTEHKSPLALRGQAKTRNIKARGEEGKTGSKVRRQGREGWMERDAALPPPYLPLFLCLWSEAVADKLGSRQLHSMVNILSPQLAVCMRAAG